MQLNKTTYIDLVDPLPKSFAPIKGEEMNRSLSYSKMRLRYVYTKRLAASNTIPQNALTAQAAIRIPCDLWKVA